MNFMTDDEINLLSDSKYKYYVNSIEKCLKNFESSTEWADLIASLGKLKKVLQSYSKYQYIPKRISICKRLAQCLHSALPSGVHLKTLEVYNVIFQIIGNDMLSRDLYLYSNGLFPLFETATLGVRPVLLSLFETYFLPLKNHLKPCLHALISCILAGLEENSDFYQRTFYLLKNICQSTSQEYFYTCLWNAILTSSNQMTRHQGIEFVLKHFDKKLTLEDQLYLIGTSIFTMINAVCSCLQDSNSLVQRTTLEFLVTCLPMYNTQIISDDKIQLILIAIHLVLRRDSSLNRRIYCWLLGQNSNGNFLTLPTHLLKTQLITPTNDKNWYFNTFSKSYLIKAIKILLNKDKLEKYLFIEQVSSISMIKIISNLVERQEIGQAIIENILIDLLLLIYHEIHEIKDSKEVSEINKALANFLFQSFQFYFIWDFCASQFSNICALNHETNDINNANLISPSLLCDLFTFILDLTNLDLYNDPKDSASAQICLPLFLKRILSTLNVHYSRLSNQEFTKSFNLCFKILSKIEDLKSISSRSPIKIQPSISVSSTKMSPKLSTSTVTSIKSTSSIKSTNIPTESEETKVSREVLNDMIEIIDTINDCLISVEDDPDYYLNRVIEKTPQNEILPITQQQNVEVETDEEETLDSIIDSCLKLIKILTHKYIHLFVIESKCIDINETFAKLFFPNNWVESLSPSLNDFNYNCGPIEIELSNSSNNYLVSYKKLNKLLIRLIFFANSIAIDQKAAYFEDWFKDFVILCTCMLKISYNFEQDSKLFQYQSITINTLLKFIYFNQVLNEKQLDLFLKKSFIGELIGHILWHFLDQNLIDHTNNNKNNAAILFCNLHETLQSNLCEDIISRNLNIDQLDSIKRFTFIWYWSKKCATKEPHRLNIPITNTFDRTVLIIFDLIDKSIAPVNRIIQEWLLRCIYDSDLDRILNLFLVYLLHPATSRVSIQFINQEKPLEQSLDSSNDTSFDYESKVYAISNEKGNIVYHVNDKQDKASKPMPQNQQSILLASLPEAKINKQQVIKSFYLELPSSITNPTALHDKLNLRINPNSEIGSDLDDNDVPLIKRATSESDFLQKYKALKQNEESKRTSKKSSSTSNKLDQSGCEADLTLSNETCDSIDENYAFILLYNQTYDYNRVLFIFNCLEKLLKLCPKEFLSSTMSMKLSNDKIKNLIFRHFVSIHGDNFYSSFNRQFNININYLELVVLILMLYIRSQFNVAHGELDSKGNRNVTIYAIQIISRILRELILLIQNQSEFDGDTLQAIFDLIENCKIHKTLLHILYSTTESIKSQTITKKILETNKDFDSETSYFYKCEIISSIQSLIHLEHLLGVRLNRKLINSFELSEQFSDDFLVSVSTKSKIKIKESTVKDKSPTNRYLKELSIVSQSMFTSSILHYLKNLNLVAYHIPILNVLKYSLPYAVQDLKSLSNLVIEQIGINLLEITHLYVNKTTNYYDYKINIPDFVLINLRYLTYLLHYCLQIPQIHTSRQSSSSFDSNFILDSSNNESSINLTRSLSKNYHAEKEKESNKDQFKELMLNGLHTIITRMTSIWKIMNSFENSSSKHEAVSYDGWFLGKPQLIKQQITDLLTPIAVHHPRAFIFGVAQAWGEVKKHTKLKIERKILLEMLKSIKSNFTIQIIIQNVSEVIRSSTNQMKEKRKSTLNIWLLQFLHAYIEHFKTIETDFYGHLSSFFKDLVSIGNMMPAAYFQLFEILHYSVTNFNTLIDDKKYSKEIQDSTHKLVELCNSVVALSLQQTTWLRKQYAVKLRTSTNGSNNSSQVTLSSQNKHDDISNGHDTPDGHLDQIIANFSDNGLDQIDQFIFDNDSNDSNNNITQSHLALKVLAQYLAKTLDIVYKSEEKERLVVPLLTSLMSNIWPYLKTHSQANRANFREASKLLMNLTCYPYTRKTWKKEVFEMLFDSPFFYIDSDTLEYWKTIIDNLMSNDRAMFKDVIVKVAYPQSSGLFTSREQEAEQKAQLLKRLAFVIYSSEKDQYQKNMPEITECVAQVLKALQSANLYSTLFFLFRILIMRISTKHMLSLWPTILSELFLVLLQMEQDLSEEPELNKNGRTSILESLTYPSINIANLTQVYSVKLNLYFSACKLLDLLLTLPYSLTAQFQLYKWSLINLNDLIHRNGLRDNHFISYLIRISNILKQKFPNDIYEIRHTNGPIIKDRQINSLRDLKYFFDTVSTTQFLSNYSQNLSTTNMKLFEKTIHDDFIEGWSS